MHSKNHMMIINTTILFIFILPLTIVFADGPHRQEVALSKGKGWIYPSLGNAFVLQNKKANAWTLFHSDG